MLKSNSSIKPYTILRYKANYHDISLNHEVASASAIRHYIETNENIDYIKENVPPQTYSYMFNAMKKSLPIFTDDFSSLLQYALLKHTSSSLLSYVDISDGLEDRILNMNDNPVSISNLIDLIKTKRFTYTRIQRSLFHILLDIKKQDFEYYVDNDFIQYIKVLGLKKDSSILLKQAKINATIPIISNVKDTIYKLNEPAKKMLEHDILSTNIYNIVVHEKFNNTIPNDFNQKFILT